VTSQRLRGLPPIPIDLPWIKSRGQWAIREDVRWGFDLEAGGRHLHETSSGAGGRHGRPEGVLAPGGAGRPEHGRRPAAWPAMRAALAGPGRRVARKKSPYPPSQVLPMLRPHTMLVPLLRPVHSFDACRAQAVLPLGWNAWGERARATASRHALGWTRATGSVIHAQCHEPDHKARSFLGT